MAVDPEELEPLVALLDDRDSVVTELVNSRLQSFGPEVVRSLRNRAERESDPERKALVVERGKWLNTEFKLADLQDFVTRSPGPLSLFEGSWIISSLLDWTLQRERYEDLFYRCSGEYLAEGSAKLADVNEKLGLRLESEDYDTIGGFVIGLLDHLPSAGEEAGFEGIRFRVERMQKKRIETIRILLP